MRPALLDSLKTYSRRQLLADCVAGLTVAMVAIPLSLAIAIASGAPPEKGLITAIIGGFLISLFGGSRVQIGGPTGAFIVVVAGVIQTHGYDGLVLATLMAGLILLVAAYLRAGSLIRFVPEAVVNGFTIGIAVIIATSQIKDVLGLNVVEVPAAFLEKLPVLWSALPSVNAAAVGVGLATLAMIVGLRAAAPRHPGLIVAVAVASCAAALWAPGVDTLGSRFGALPNHLPWPAIPDISLERLVTLLPSALVIAFLAGIESLLSAMVADQITATSHRPNAEIRAQGIANVASALFAGLPATGAIARTATNIRAGAATPVAGLVHAMTVLVVMLVAAPLAGYLAMPALAALLLLTAWGMSEPHKWPSYARLPRSDKVVLLLTLTLTVAADLTVAIAVGVAVGLALRLQSRGSQP